MANNIFVGPNAVVAKAAGNFVDAGINGTNTTIIYRVAASTVSYVPGRSINGVTAFEEGKGYYIIAKQNMDLTTLLIPPVPGGEVPPDGDGPPDEIGSTSVEPIYWDQNVNAFPDGGDPGNNYAGSAGTSGSTGVKRVGRHDNNYVGAKSYYGDENGIIYLDDQNDANYTNTVKMGLKFASDDKLYKVVNGVETLLQSPFISGSWARMRFSGMNVVIEWAVGGYTTGGTGAGTETITDALLDFSILYVKSRGVGVGGNMISKAEMLGAIVI